jgi:hypothetical protein
MISNSLDITELYWEQWCFCILSLRLLLAKKIMKRELMISVMLISTLFFMMVHKGSFLTDYG